MEPPTKKLAFDFSNAAHLRLLIETKFGRALRLKILKGFLAMGSSGWLDS